MLERMKNNLKAKTDSSISTAQTLKRVVKRKIGYETSPTIGKMPWKGDMSRKVAMEVDEEKSKTDEVGL